MNTERDDREQIEAIRKMMAEKEEKKRAREIRKELRRKRIHALLHGKFARDGKLLVFKSGNDVLNV